ncbi:hypothetical protein [Streptomyces acidiscabies]|uniref:hypothetical protein n=1 Tax=Streptomyces acidiscabies TaxID=42234 RepID=UPI0038D446CF
MVRQQWWRGQGLAAVAVLAVAGCGAVDDPAASRASDAKPSVSSSAGIGVPGGEADTGTLPGVPAAEQARAELKVAAHGSMSGYSRSKFPHWVSQGASCDTRDGPRA